MEQKKKRRCQELLLEFKEKKLRTCSCKLKFDVGDDRDVYNITAPFLIDGTYIIAGRVEKRESEVSQVIFFEKRENIWTRRKDLPVLDLQDPFVTFIRDEIVLGGVEIYEQDEGSGEFLYRTVFYRGRGLNTLKQFVKGPKRMKDIRLFQVDEERILVFTRPQGVIGGRGTIAYTVIKELNELSEKTVEEAVLLKNQFYEQEWGGVNEIHLLNNGLIGVLSHIARFDDHGGRHYYSSCFAFHLNKGAYSSMKLIAVRDDFMPGAWKRPDLKDVIFSGGLIRKKDGKAELYCGVSDAEAHCIVIDDPFIEYERWENLYGLQL